MILWEWMITHDMRLGCLLLQALLVIFPLFSSSVFLFSCCIKLALFTSVLFVFKSMLLIQHGFICLFLLFKAILTFSLSHFSILTPLILLAASTFMALLPSSFSHLFSQVIEFLLFILVGHEGILVCCLFSLPLLSCFISILLFFFRQSLRLILQSPLLLLLFAAFLLPFGSAFLLLLLESVLFLLLEVLIVLAVVIVQVSELICIHVWQDLVGTAIILGLLAFELFSPSLFKFLLLYLLRSESLIVVSLFLG